MATISDLSDDLVREVFSRVPLTSLNAVRSTCKMWNTTSKNHILGKKVPSHQFLEFMVSDSRVCSLRFDLQGIRNKEDLIDTSIKQLSIPNNHQVEISNVYHCDGLLLCVAKHNSSLVVWNPYLGQTKCIQPRNDEFNIYDRFALGHDNNHNHKILRFLYDGERNRRGLKRDIDVYDFSSDSWRVLEVNPDGDVPIYYSGVSLKGNTYFFAQDRFGKRLPLPFNPPSPTFEYLTLSWARNEKLAVLYNHYDTFETYDIWISTKIEPNAVTWSTFLTVDMSLINGLPDGFSTKLSPRSFFIDEEEKVAVLFFTYGTGTCINQMAFIVGGDGYFKSVNIGLLSNSQGTRGELVCSSYVLSLVQLQV
ncbi:F-box protein At3g49510 isoform X2 [Capsella rubella]|uniref:F-box protein At3g49510 isoform X2 n=1 Tax=Capsella rubella TaxID=81985 RepID=UPI000CD53D88|nr:F-box protein At3g49510 isoform X2 [Capsella rubella]